MATCYRCGASGANYRRTTYTGFSTGSWSSKRSYGSSSRTYYGVRSVCQNCAKSIDTWNRIKLIFWAVVIIIAFYYISNHSVGSYKGSSSLRATSPYHYSGQTAKIISTKGLNLRDQPSASGTVLLTIPYNEIVGIIDKNGVSETISGHTANWYKVDYRGKEGWVWSRYVKAQ
jgi:uncharacterized protein YgiM (DUF1202 family)